MLLAAAILCLLPLPACAIDPAPSVEARVRGILGAQADAWNRGDIPAFMEHYWKSEDLSFSSGGKLTRGWQPTLDGYRKRYPDRAAMGHLTFDNLEVRALGGAAALVLGSWHLARDANPVGGLFSLVFERIDGRWVIVHDHTSRSESP